MIMMFSRQRVLLSAISALGGKGIFSKTFLVKALFLLRQRLGFAAIGYDFFPYKYGPFSMQVYDDIGYLERENLLEGKSLCLTEKGKLVCSEIEIPPAVQGEMQALLGEFHNAEEIKQFVYAQYPAFTVCSNKPAMPRKTGQGICSIGYEGRTIDGFLDTLIQNNVSVLVDVRNNAFSMKKGFSKKQLKERLAMAGIAYMHAPKLGIESKKRKNIENTGQREKLFQEYKAGLSEKEPEIREIAALAKKQKIALMCFEADPLQCHRQVLIQKIEESYQMRASCI